MAKINPFLLVGATAMLFAFGTMIHHYGKHGYWIDLEDVQSHEFVAGIFLALAIAFLIGGVA